MIKLLNKLIFHLKNLILPIDLVATIFIVMNMFQRLGKDIFGSNLLEFIQIIFPFVLLLILWFINLIFKNESIKNNTFYNIVSILVVCTIFIFCYRAIMDENMLFWHKYGYKINFNYFSDQIGPIKVMLYGLSIADILFIISSMIKIDNDENKSKKVNKKNNKES